MTEALARLEGLERGPAGNISLAAAFSIAREMGLEETVVVQETEYTGAGKHIQPQLSYARENGVAIKIGDPADEIPGSSIIIPASPGLIKTQDLDMESLRKSLIKNLTGNSVQLTERDYMFLMEESKSSREFVETAIKEWEIS